MTQPPARPLAPLARPAAMLLALLALLSVARLTLYGIHHDAFGDLGAGEVLATFVRGARFDVAIACGVAGLPLFLLALPFGWARSRRWQTTWGWVTYAAFAALALLVVADLVYFGYVQRHIGPEIAIATDDLGTNLQLVVEEYPYALVALGAVFVAAALLWRRLLRRPVAAPTAPLAGRVCGAAALAGLVLAGARGGFGEDRLTMEDAFDGSTPRAAQLVLNGPFTAVSSYMSTGLLDVDFYPWDEALETTRELLVAPDEVLLDGDYPLWRARSGEERPRPNVVIVLLEGWSASTVDALRARSGLEPRGLTPHLDALGREGVVFTRHYAMGERTRHGIAAVIAGVPAVPKAAYLGTGLERTPLGYLGHLARREGYETYFVQGSRRDSQQLDKICKLAGFEHFSGGEDIPGRKTSRPGAMWMHIALDHDTLAEANRQFAAARRPFLGVIHTASTHEPYRWWPKDDAPFPGDSREHRYWNAVAYADRALGEFIASAKAAGYYDDTVFVLTSDHIQRRMEGDPGAPGLFHVPCVVVGPGLEPRVDERVTSQVDIIPTLAHAAGWLSPYAAFGRSLLDDARPPAYGAVCMTPHMVVRIEDDGWVAHNLEQRLESGVTREGADLDAIERRLLAFTQVATKLVFGARIRPAEDDRP